MQTENKRDFQLDVLRVILVVLVIFGHSTFYKISTKYGGIDYYTPLVEEGFRDASIHVMLDYLKGIVYKFHMPAFVFLSGIIFRKECDRNKYHSIRLLIAKKNRRLIIPCLLAWLLWNIPIKYFSGYYQFQDNPLISALLQILNPYQVHLWYLEALFFIFLVFYYLKKVSSVWIKVSISIALYFVGIVIRYKFGAPIGNPFLYVIWFEIGYDELFRKNDRNNRIVLYIVILIAFYYATLKIQFSWVLLDLLMGYLGIQLLYNLSKCIFSIGGGTNSVLRAISNHSLGIYLYSDPLNYLIIYMFVKYFGIASLSNSSYAILLFLLRFCLSFAIAYFVDVLIGRCKLVLQLGGK